MEKEIKHGGLKYFLFIGLPVIVILIALGCYYYFTSPQMIFKNSLQTFYKTINENLETKNNSFQIKPFENPYSFGGVLNFETSMDLGELKPLQDYSYSFDMGVDYEEKIAKANFNLSKETENILGLNAYFKNQDSFLESPKLLKKLIKLDNNGNDDLFTVLGKDGSLSITDDETKEALTKIKNILEKNINSQSFEREKKDITINKETVKTTKNSIVLTKQKLKEVYEKIKNEILSDETLTNQIAKLIGKTKDELKTIFDSLPELFPEETIYLQSYTTGFLPKVVKVSLASETSELFSFTQNKSYPTLKMDYKNMKIVLELKENTEQKLVIDFEISEDLKGTFTIDWTKKSNTEGSFNVNISLKQKENTFDINLYLVYNLNDTIKIPETDNAIPMNELKNEDFLEIFTNLETVLKDTFFIDLIENGIM